MQNLNSNPLVNLNHRFCFKSLKKVFIKIPYKENKKYFTTLLFDSGVTAIGFTAGLVLGAIGAFSLARFYYNSHPADSVDSNNNKTENLDAITKDLESQKELNSVLEKKVDLLKEDINLLENHVSYLYELIIKIKENLAHIARFEPTQLVTSLLNHTVEALRYFVTLVPSSDDEDEFLSSSFESLLFNESFIYFINSFILFILLFSFSFFKLLKHKSNLSTKINFLFNYITLKIKRR
jgi:hypothetical protein